jgi:hypothetical protein
MLQPLRSSREKMRLCAFTETVAATVVTIGNGGDQIKTATSASTGLLTAPFRYPFSRTPVSVFGRDNTGGWVDCYATTPTAQSTYGRLVGYGMAAEDGVFYGITAGFGSTNTTELTPRGNMVKATWNKPLLLGCQIASDGTVNIGTKNFACTHTTSSGIYTITFKNIGIGNVLAVVPTVVSTGIRGAAVSGVSAAGFTITTYSAGSVNDEKFNVIVAASRTRYPVCTRTSDVYCNMRKPRLFAWQLTTTTPTTWVIGSEQESVKTYVSTGYFTLAHVAKYRFAREPIVVATCVDAQAVTVVPTSTTGLAVRTWGQATHGAANAAVNILMLGSDDALEY